MIERRGFAIERCKIIVYIEKAKTKKDRYSVEAC